MKQFASIAVAAALLLGTGCRAGEVTGETPASGTAHHSSAAAQPLSPEAIALLKERIPELREESQPEPQPRRDATPENVPAPVKEVLPPEVLETVRGGATFYADKFEGRRTASGIPFRQNQLVAAHRAYPFGTLLRVTNPRNDRSVNVRVVDRGPFGAPDKAQRPIIDLSRRAATEIDIIQAGRAQVQVEVLQWGRGVEGNLGS
jgi:rare lipoprotein A